jgi:hypothetical protein
MHRVAIPLRERRVDWLFLGFILLNATVITYAVDLEQLVVADPAHFDQPLWPPAPLVDLVHWYGNRWDQLLIARPPFWQMTIWIDVLLFGPYYVAALYAFARGRDWIRVPALVWSGTMLANVLIILMEERYGEHPAPAFWVVVAANASWLLMPLATVWRMRRDHPFTRTAAAPVDGPAAVPA